MRSHPLFFSACRRTHGSCKEPRSSSHAMARACVSTTLFLGEDKRMNGLIES